jgi:hypothetical protein
MTTIQDLMTWHSALVSDHCIGRGVDSWGSEI